MHRFRRLNLSIIVFWFELFNYFNYWLIISCWPSSTWSRSAASTVFIRSAPLESLIRIVMNTVVFFQCIWRLFQHPEDCFYKWKQYSVNSWHLFVCSRAQHTHIIDFLIAAQYYYHHISMHSIAIQKHFKQYHFLQAWHSSFLLIPEIWTLMWGSEGCGHFNCSAAGTGFAFKWTKKRKRRGL